MFVQAQGDCSAKTGAHGGDAAHEDEDVVADGRRGGPLLGVALPEAPQQPPVHEGPIHVHGAVELHAHVHTIRYWRHLSLEAAVAPCSMHAYSVLYWDAADAEGPSSSTG